MKYRIIGDAIQAVAVELASGESIISRLGGLLFVKGAVKSESNQQGAFWAAMTENLAANDEPPFLLYKCETGGGLIGLTVPGPGRIYHINLDQTSRFIVRRNAIIAASDSLHIERLHLSGEDSGDVPSRIFVTVSGCGMVFLHGAGNLIDFTLKDKEQMAVDGMMILSMEGEIGFEPKPVGKPAQAGPIPYVMLMHLTGPGKVILSTLRKS